MESFLHLFLKKSKEYRIMTDKIKVFLNGLGNTGVTIFRNWVELLNEDKAFFDIVAIGSTSSIDVKTHKINYNTNYGRFPYNVFPEYHEWILLQDFEKRIQCFASKDPSKLPLNDLEIDVVIEATGKFRTKEGVQKYLDAGAGQVFVSAPFKGEDASETSDATLIWGINHEKYDLPKKFRVVSNASCTTHALAPAVKVLNSNLNIVSAMFSTIHAGTSSQKVVDGSDPKDWRRARNALENIIPTTTGADKVIGIIFPEMKEKIKGSAIRVPTSTVSIIELYCIVDKSTTVEEVNNLFKTASETYMKGHIEYVVDPLVSSDFKGSIYACSFDPLLTQVIDGKFVKVTLWYDNEWGYSYRMVQLLNHIAKVNLGL